MSSEMREIQHDQHTHPGPREYVIIGLILFVLTMVEYGLYLAEDRFHLLAAGPAAVLIAIVSAAKFIIVVAYYMLARKEEREMVQRFGDTYRRYQQQVPMFIPRWGRWGQMVETSRADSRGNN